MNVTTPVRMSKASTVVDEVLELAFQHGVWDLHIQANLPGLRLVVNPESGTLTDSIEVFPS